MEMASGNAVSLLIVDIFLQILAVIVEAGREKRSIVDENVLVSMLQDLERVSLYSSMLNDSDGGEVCDDETSSSMDKQCEISEMANHLRLKILMRGLETDESHAAGVHGVGELDSNDLIDISRDLNNPHPAVRARCLSIISDMIQTKIPDRKLVDDVDNSDVRDRELLLIQSIYSLLFEALADDESFVYLSAVYGLWRLSDKSPQLILAQLMDGLANDELNTYHRIKVGEALMYTIRRRGPAIAQYSRMLVNRLLYLSRLDKVSAREKIEAEPGLKCEEIRINTHMMTEALSAISMVRSNGTTKLKSVQSETKEEEEETSTTDNQSNEKKQKAGGHVLLRTTYVSLLAELAQFSGYSLVGLTDNMIDLAMHVLQLENKKADVHASNTMSRRSAAYLLRSLFDPKKSLEEFLDIGKGHWSGLLHQLSRASESDSDSVVRFHCECALEVILARFQDIVNLA